MQALSKDSRKLVLVKPGLLGSSEGKVFQRLGNGRAAGCVSSQHFLAGVQLTYNDVLVSALQPSDSVTRELNSVTRYTFFLTLFPTVVYHRVVF